MECHPSEFPDRNCKNRFRKHDFLRSCHSKRHKIFDSIATESGIFPMYYRFQDFKEGNNHFCSYKRSDTVSFLCLLGNSCKGFFFYIITCCWQGGGSYKCCSNPLHYPWGRQEISTWRAHTPETIKCLPLRFERVVSATRRQVVPPRARRAWRLLLSAQWNLQTQESGEQPGVCLGEFSHSTKPRLG